MLSTILCIEWITYVHMSHCHLTYFQLCKALNLQSRRHYMGIDPVPLVKPCTTKWQNTRGFSCWSLIVSLCWAKYAIAARALSVARAIEPQPTHFARVRALGVTRTHNAARALCVGLCTLHGPAHFVWARALCNPRAWRPMHWYPFPCDFQPIQFAIQANQANTIFNPRAESEPPP